MIHIREETPADVAEISRIVEAAFGVPDEARLVEALRRDPAFDASLSLVAVLDARVVGHILFTPIVIEGSSVVHRAIALAPMAVFPEFQKQGIGTLLVRQGLQRGRERGHARVIVLGHETYYPRFGFLPASRFGIRAPFKVPDAAFMAIALSPGALDDSAGVVVYPPAFMNV